MTGGKNDLERSKKYSLAKSRILLANLGLTVLFLIFFQIFFSRSIAVFAVKACSYFYGIRLLFASMFFGCMYLVHLPLSFISSFYLEHRYGLSRQSFFDWIKDEAKASLLSIILMFFCVLGFYSILRNLSSLWWVVSAAAWILFSIVLTRFVPVFIIPLFYKYLPIENNELKKKILALAERTHVSIKDVSLIDLSRKTAKANAALVGLGKTRKVIISDTLEENFTHEEIESVVAHEFGHFKHKHIWKLLLSSGVSTFVVFYMMALIMDKIVALTGLKG